MIYYTALLSFLVFRIPCIFTQSLIIKPTAVCSFPDLFQKKLSDGTSYEAAKILQKSKPYKCKSTFNYKMCQLRSILTGASSLMSRLSLSAAITIYEAHKNHNAPDYKFQQFSKGQFGNQ